MILDVMLPGLSGYEVVRPLRAEQNWVPVLMLSAKDGEYDQADGLDCGADDYLTKPFSYVVLLARLRALLRRGAPRAAGRAHRRRPAARPGRAAGSPRADAEVVLTSREYALLEYLMRRPGEVVTKTELLDHVWDAAVDTAPNAVEVYVGYLRRKIGRERLETVRGAGYRLATVQPLGTRAAAAPRACGPGWCCSACSGWRSGSRRRGAAGRRAAAGRCSARSTRRRCAPPTRWRC